MHMINDQECLTVWSPYQIRNFASYTVDIWSEKFIEEVLNA